MFFFSYAILRLMVAKKSCTEILATIYSGLMCHLIYIWWSFLRILTSYECIKVDEVVSQFDSFAKKAAAFFKISRSILPVGRHGSSRLFSFFSRRFSASKSLRVMPLSLRSCWSWRYSRTQREILEAATPSRLPTSGQLYLIWLFLN